MDDNTIYIEQLVLQIPGLSKAEAHQLGYQVANHIAARLPDRVQSLQLSELQLKLRIAEGETGDRLAQRIADAIVEKLR
jgi:uncharacterized protein (DUF169 family)